MQIKSFGELRVTATSSSPFSVPFSVIKQMLGITVFAYSVLVGVKHERILRSSESVGTQNSIVIFCPEWVSLATHQLALIYGERSFEY